MTTEIAPSTPTQSCVLVTPKGSKIRAARKAKGNPNSKLHNTMTTEIAPFTPTSSRILVTPKGTERGKRFLFTGTQTASELRATLKAKGVTGSELTKQVNDVLRGSATLCTQLALAFIVQEAQRGVVYHTGDALKKSSVLRGTCVEDKPAKAPKAKPAPSIDDVLATMTEEQATEAIAKIAAKFGS